MIATTLSPVLSPAQMAETLAEAPGAWLLEAGVNGWGAAGLPVVRGPRRLSLEWLPYDRPGSGDVATMVHAFTVAAPPIPVGRAASAPSATCSPAA